MNEKPLAVLPLFFVAACAGTSGTEDPRASADLHPASGSQVRGHVSFIQSGERVRVVGDITGHTPGRKGFHIHERGDGSAPDAMSAAGHYYPAQMQEDDLKTDPTGNAGGRAACGVIREG